MAFIEDMTELYVSTAKRIFLSGISNEKKHLLSRNRSSFSLV